MPRRGAPLNRVVPVLCALAVTCVSLVPTAAAGGVTGPDPLVNGDFSAAVPGTHVIPGWAAHSFFDPTETWVVAERVDGDMKVHTLGHRGWFGGPTNLGFSAERPTYSLLFGNLTFEVTDRNGDALASSGLRVMLLAEWTAEFARHPVDEPNETSIALVWDDVGTVEAADGLDLSNVDRVIDFRGNELDYTFGPNGTFSERELANEWEMGGLKIRLPARVLHLDDFRISEPTLFGTYR